MRFFVVLIFVALFIVLGERVLSLAVKGELFKPGAFKAAFHEMGKTLWLAMRLFVILWIAYLLIVWFMSRQS